MKRLLDISLNWFFKQYQLRFQTYWFKKALYFFLVVKTIAWLWFYDLYFGANAIVYSKHFLPSGLRDVPFLLYAYSSPVLAYFFIVPLLCMCLFALKFDKHYFIADFFIWFLIININNKIYPTLTGGDYLLNQFLFFNCWLCSQKKADSTPHWSSDLKKFFHNLSIIAIIIQVCLVYFLSALAKCNDENWISGNALDEISKVHHFSLFSVIPRTASSSVFLMIINYVIVFYQLLFPLLIWIKKIKRPFICFGILMHLYIALVMGLVEFSVIMLIAYIYFWPTKKTIT
jgi:hypothetical protein